MTRWHRAAVELRHALTKRSLILPASTSLYSTSTPPKNPRKPRTPPQEQQSPKSWVTFNTASDQMEKMMVFEEQDENTVVELDERRWPKPSEIPWQAKVANCVNLIGHIKMPIQFRSDDDGKKSLAASVIRWEIRPKSNPLWIPVLFEGDLAHVVACHVKENDYVYVAGHLSAEPSPFNLSTGTQSLQLIAESINFVDEPSRVKKYVSITRQKDGTQSNDNIPVIQSWRDLLLKPHEWWDIRLEKGNSNGAAFKRKDNGELLFIDELTPQWLLRNLECLTFDRKITEIKQKTAGGRFHDASLGPWKDLLEETELWRDYRREKKDGKVSAKYPDFKRKDGSVSLWLNMAPKYILSELDNLNFDVPQPSPKPTQPSQLAQPAQPSQLAQPAQPAKRNKGEESWKDLIENPHQWLDTRSKKSSEKAPDFKRKDTGEALWLNSAPKHILSALENVDFGGQTSVRAKIVKGEELWKDVVENPKKWWDNRLNKLNQKSPDFKHKDTGEALWLSGAPGWVHSKLPPSKATPSFGSVTKEESMMS